MAADWVPAAITGVSGFAAGGLVGWFSRPMAAAKAQERTKRNDHRRKILDDARAMVQERSKGHLDLNNPIGNDPRFLAIQSALSKDVAAKYTGKNLRLISMGGFPDLTADLNRLEKKWNLV